jgi:SpoVK/Ycf46/Vps4 family AAA+-type ATPase
MFGGGCGGDMDFNGALDAANKSSSANNEQTQAVETAVDDSAYPYKWIGENIKNIDDLINLGKSYNPDDKVRYSLDMRKMHKLVEPLTELKNMIGLTEIKQKMFDMVMYYLQNLDHKNYDMLHSIITGPPGVGKTQLINIIAKIYNRLGFLKTDNVIFAKREDFVAGYVGQTAIKTRKLLEKSIGGVLVLDEAYSLGDSSMEGKDSFGREAINTITPFLSEHTHDFAMILAGYKDDIDKLLMTQNPGLERRFPDINRFNISGYDPKELQLIFKNTLETQGWQLDIPLEKFAGLFETNFKYFNYFGGDMLTLFTVCKKVHSRRLVSIADESVLSNSKKRINLSDIEEAIQFYLIGAKGRKTNKTNETSEVSMTHLYG